MRDISPNIGIVQAIAPAVQAATVTSDPLDLLGFNSAALLISTGAIAGSGDFTAKLQDSDSITGADFTDVSDEFLSGELPDSLEAGSLVKQGYRGNRRYIRVVITKNSGTSIAASASLIKGHPGQSPVA